MLVYNKNIGEIKLNGTKFHHRMSRCRKKRIPKNKELNEFNEIFSVDILMNKSCCHSDSSETHKESIIIVPGDHYVKMTESEKIDKYLDRARELRKLGNMKVKFVPIIIGAL